MFHLSYGIPTYTQFDYCRYAIESIIRTSTLVPDKLIIIDNSETGEGTLALHDLVEKHHQVYIIPRTENILAGAWNNLMQINDDYIIIANDDVIPHPQSIMYMVEAATQQPDIAMWNGSGHSGNSYSFFLLRKWAYDRVGIFDENFVPAYFEDNDYDYRLKLAGLIREEVPSATFDHIGSATVKNMSANRLIDHHRAFLKCQQYYRLKWGELPGKELFKRPFEKMISSDIADL